MPFDVIPPQHTQHPLPLLPRDLWTVCAGSTDRRSRGGADRAAFRATDASSWRGLRAGQMCEMAGVPCRRPRPFFTPVVLLTAHARRGRASPPRPTSHVGMTYAHPRPPAPTVGT